MPIFVGEGRVGARQVCGGHASLEGSGGERRWVLSCVVCASTQREKFVDFADETKIVFELGRTYLTSIFAPMAEEWERSNYM